MNQLEAKAQILIEETLRYAESKEGSFNDIVRTTILNNIKFREAVASVLAEAENLTEVSNNQWDQIVKNRSPLMKEIADFHAIPDTASPSGNKQLAINNQVAISLYVLFCFTSSVAKTFFNSLSLQKKVLEEDYIDFANDISSKFLSQAPEWKKGILFVLKYPGVFSVIQKSITEKLLAFIPSIYKRAAKTMQDESLAVTFQTIMFQIMQSGTIPVENSKNIGFLNLLNDSISQDESMLALANQHLAVMSKVFSEKLDTSLIDKNQENIEIQAYINSFIASFKQELQAV